jgi:cytochrome b pre-mRNA-processing protein 3
MLGFLFRGLTAAPARGAALFDGVTREARRPGWYLEDGVPDTLDGRFAVLATITALAMVRLEQLGEEGEALSVALTERFIEVMETEHRELGLGDPTLGKTVRKLVGSLSRRTDLARATVTGDHDWRDFAGQALYKSDPDPAPIEAAAAALEQTWTRLARCDVMAIAEGRIE